VANTLTKITARYGYAMVRNGKKRENPYFSSVAATLEKAITYVFAESPFRNAEVRGSIPPLLHHSFQFIYSRLQRWLFWPRWSIRGHLLAIPLKKSEMSVDISDFWFNMSHLRTISPDLQVGARLTAQ
jgi:hypothetical protein